LVRTLPCHGRGRGFESRRPRQFFQALARNWQFASWSNLVPLGQCFSLVEHHPNKFALFQPLVRHARLSVKIRRNAPVCMTYELLYRLHFIVVLSQQELCACDGRCGIRPASGCWPSSLPAARIVAREFLARAVACLSSSARQTPSLFRNCTDQPASA